MPLVLGEAIQLSGKLCQGLRLPKLDAIVILVLGHLDCLAGRICILWYWQATQLGRDEITLPIRRFVALRTDSAALRSDCSAARHEPTSS